MNRQIPLADLKQQSLLRDATFWRLISLLLDRPTAGWQEMLRTHASIVEDPDLQESVAAAQVEASEGLYYSIFSPGGILSPREVRYHSNLDLGGLLSVLTGYYNAFGYCPASDETPDHIAVETGFVGYLKLKEAYALACEDTERAQMTAEASHRFIEDHLAAMAHPIGEGLAASGIRYLALAGSALVRRIGRQT